MAGITITNLTKSYTADANAAAVRNLNIAVSDNCFLTLLGPSGCGKTTTLRLIAGYLKPDAGEIRVGEKIVSSVSGVAPPESRGMGMVFQNYAIWPHMTVFDNVAFGLKLRKLPKADIGAKVDAMLKLVNLGGLEARYPNELSGGQQQRVALARSLVVEPDILLLDEPLSNLDAKLRERMRSELKQLQRRTGITFVYVTHDQAEALALSDQIAVMHGGLLQQLGSPQDVYERPANRVVADFMGLTNIIPATVESIAEGQARISATGVTLTMSADETLKAGDAVDLVVRPENIRLQQTVPSDTAPRIADRTFLGNLVEYQVALGDGTMLRIEAHPSQRLSPGDAVAIEFDTRACSIFPAQA